LTGKALDFMIYNGSERGSPSIFMFGCSLYANIKHVRLSVKPFSEGKNLVDKVAWEIYPFVLMCDVKATLRC
jgi:hypothetical protein